LHRVSDALPLHPAKVSSAASRKSKKEQENAYEKGFACDDSTCPGQRAAGGGF
jgi:hypothetical protein